MATSDGLAVTVPFDAVDHLQFFSVVETTSIPPPGVASLSPTYRFDPPGQVFARPVAVRLPFRENGAAPAVFWSTADGGYDEIGGEVDGGFIVASVVRLGQGFVAPSTGHRTIWGTAANTSVTAAGIKNTMVAMHAFDAEAFVLQPDGGFRQYPSIGWADGTFEIRQVPTGPAYIRWRDGIVVTSASAVDFGVVNAGRADAVDPANDPPARLDLAVDNMSAWADGDGLQFVSPHSGAWYYGLEHQHLGRVDAGDTAIQFSFDTTAGYPNHLISAAAGDRGYLEHLAARQSDGGWAYRAVVELFEPAPFSQSVNGTVSLNGSFAPGVETTASAHFDVSSFSRAALSAPLVPDTAGAPPLSGFMTISSNPWGLEHGVYWYAPVAASLDLPVDIDAGVIATGGLAFVEPSDARWGEVYGVSFGGWAFFDFGNGGSFGLFAGLSQQRPLASVASGVLGARLGVVSNPLVNGRDFLTAATAIGTDLTLSWTPPTLGMTDRYLIHIYHVAMSGVSAVTLVTHDTVVKVPPGILVAGDSYFFVIEAQSGEGERVEAPWRAGASVDSASRVSALFVP